MVGGEKKREEELRGGGAKQSGRGYGEEACPPVVVEPGAVTGDDDVVRLLRHVVLAGVHQPIHLHLALLLVVLQVASEGDRGREMMMRMLVGGKDDQEVK